MHSDDVTVVVFFKNEEKYMIESLLSITNQTKGAKEIILVDDHSTDMTFSLLTDFIKDGGYTNIKLVKSSGVGKVVAYQTGLRMVSTRWFCVCAGDDVLLPNYIEENLKYVKANSVEFCLNSFYICDENLCVDSIASGRDIKSNEILFRNVASGYLFCEKNIIDQFLPFPKKLEFEDWFINILLYDKYGFISKNTIPLFYYRRHSESSTKASLGDYQKKNRLYHRDLSVLNLIINNRMLKSSNFEVLKMSYQLRNADTDLNVDFKYLVRIIYLVLKGAPIKEAAYSLARYSYLLMSKVFSRC